MSVPNPPTTPDPPTSPESPTSPGPPGGEKSSGDDVSVRLTDLAAELAGLRTETRSELGHLGSLIRTEGVRISRQISSELADLKGVMTPYPQDRSTLTRWHLAIAQVAAIAAIAVLMRLML